MLGEPGYGDAEIAKLRAAGALTDLIAQRVPPQAGGSLAQLLFGNIGNTFAYQ
jgi:hypothetical protein